MDQEKAYNKFQEASLSTPDVPGALPPPYHFGGNVPHVPPPPSFEMDKQVINDVRHTRRLANFEMILSWVLLIFGVMSTGLGVNIRYYTIPCTIYGANIWAPVLGIFAAGLGLGALRYGDYSRKCLLVSHFVMCIISAIASGILVSFISLCLTSSSWIIALSHFEAFILVGALVHLIASIVSTAFICRYWCGRKDNAGTSSWYNPSHGANGSGPKQAITGTTGLQVIFVQPDAAGDPTPATVAVAP